MIRGAIFDMDGTLLDSMGMWDTVGVEYLKKMGITADSKLSEDIQAMYLQQMAEYIIDYYDLKCSVEDIRKGIYDIADVFYHNEVECKPYVETFLQKLKEHGVKMSVATATDRPQVITALKRCGIYDYFDCIFTAPEVGKGKEVPDIYRCAQESMGTRKNETVVFEDLLLPVTTAAKDGFLTVGVDDCHSGAADKIRETADYYLTDYRNFDEFWRMINEQMCCSGRSADQ